MIDPHPTGDVPRLQSADGCTRRATSTRFVAFGAIASLLSTLGAIALTGTAGAGRTVPDKTIPTLPPSSSEVAIDTGIGIPPWASFVELTAIAGQVPGRSDVSAALRTLVVLPEGIRSPVDARIHHFSVDYYGQEEPYYEASVTLTSPATPEDALTFYRTTLTAAGLVLTDDVQDTSETDTTFGLRFDNSNSDYADASVEVSIVDGEEDSVTVTITDHAEDNVLAAFASWADGLSAIDEGVPISATLSAEQTDQLAISVLTTYGYDDRSADQLNDQIRAAVEAGSAAGYAIADDDEGDHTIRLRSSFIPELQATITPGTSHQTELQLAASGLYAASGVR